mmetsp:Transcript_6971/g.42675  ORF Transcript_6971/g.42675 Transcript_6971/m.42675 type:complete len:409 (+) Transcript_6971:5116-6342(+)
MRGRGQLPGQVWTGVFRLDVRPLDSFQGHTHQEGGMQGSVPVALGMGDVILVSAGCGRPELVRDVSHDVAGVDGPFPRQLRVRSRGLGHHHHAQSEKVAHVFFVSPFAAQKLPHGGKQRFPPGRHAHGIRQRRKPPVLHQRILKLGFAGGQGGRVAGVPFPHPIGQRGVALGEQDGEGAIFQLVTHLSCAKRVGEGRVDLHGFQRELLPSPIGQGSAVSHQIQTPRQRHGDGPRVVERQAEVSQRPRRRVVVRRTACRQGTQACGVVGECGHARARDAFHLFQAHRTAMHGVGEQSGDGGFRAQAQLGEMGHHVHRSLGSRSSVFRARCFRKHPLGQSERVRIRPRRTRFDACSSDGSIRRTFVPRSVVVVVVVVGGAHSPPPLHIVDVDVDVWVCLPAVLSHVFVSG